MRWIIFFFGSGMAFFAGVALVIAAAFAFSLHRNRWSITAATLTALSGLLLIGVSATPLPPWTYAVAALVSVVWLLFERLAFGAQGRRRVVLRCAAAFIWAAAALWEISYHLPRPPVGPRNPKFAVIGDSVTAGMGGEKTTWPKILADTHSVEVVDLARMGATVGSAMKQADALPDDCNLLLLEIGGNDVLGTTTSADFDRNLGALLERVCVPGRTVLMFELPLPPGANEFGRIQRRRAAEFGVVLIPKRAMAGILSGEGATLDSIHLGRRGHERMAELVWDIIGPAYED